MCQPPRDGACQKFMAFFFALWAGRRPPFSQSTEFFPFGDFFLSRFTPCSCVQSPSSSYLPRFSSRNALPASRKLHPAFFDFMNFSLFGCQSRKRLFFFPWPRNLGAKNFPPPTNADLFGVLFFFLLRPFGRPASRLFLPLFHDGFALCLLFFCLKETCLVKDNVAFPFSFQCCFLGHTKNFFPTGTDEFSSLTFLSRSPKLQNWSSFLSGPEPSHHFPVCRACFTMLGAECGPFSLFSPRMLNFPPSPFLSPLLQGDGSFSQWGNSPQLVVIRNPLRKYFSLPLSLRIPVACRVSPLFSEESVLFLLFSITSLMWSPTELDLLFFLYTMPLSFLVFPSLSLKNGGHFSLPHPPPPSPVATLNSAVASPFFSRG